MSALGSLRPCGAAAIGDGPAFRDLPLPIIAPLAAKLFEILSDIGANPRSCAVLSRTGVVPDFPSSARKEPTFPYFCDAAKARFGVLPGKETCSSAC